MTFSRDPRLRPGIGSILVVVLVLAVSAAAAALEFFPTSRLVISSGERRHDFVVELAVTTAQRAQGLMWRRRLAADRGMLFLYDRERIIRMWMKNTLIPLDMLFIDRRGTIVRIHQRAVPGSVQAISSVKRARAVLELAGGTASRLGIGVGDKVIHPAFGPP